MQRRAKDFRVLLQTLNSRPAMHREVAVVEIRLVCPDDEQSRANCQHKDGNLGLFRRINLSI
jgi:hypothetical protein